MINLVTAANKPYMEKIAPYLHSIQEHGGAFDRRVLITVGCQVGMPEALNNITPVSLPSASVQGHTGNYCVQQGCFLEALGTAADDVLIFTDGDIVMQRAPTVAELSWIGAIPDATIALAWNAGPNDTLADEGTRIGLTPGGQRMFAGLLHRKVYNVGVIICRVSTYRAIYARYMELWPVFYPLTNHYAANQFLMCAVIAELGLLVWEMHPTLHTHGCFGVPGWADLENDLLTVDSVPVLFKHHF